MNYAWIAMAATNMATAETNWKFTTGLTYTNCMKCIWGTLSIVISKGMFGKSC